eukprot:1384238-Amphidinium_carterae.3
MCELRPALDVGLFLCHRLRRISMSIPRLLNSAYAFEAKKVLKTSRPKHMTWSALFQSANF